MKRLWKQLDLKKRLKMDLKDKIFNYIINSNRINESIDNIVEDKKYIEDFKQHFYIQMLEMDEEKLSRAYLEGWIDWLCIRVMLNQWRSKNSSFYTTYTDEGATGNNFAVTLIYKYGACGGVPVAGSIKQEISETVRTTYLNKQKIKVLRPEYLSSVIDLIKTSLNSNQVGKSFKIVI